MQYDIFEAGGTQDRILSRTDTRHIGREIERLEQQRKICRTVPEYDAISQQINRLVHDAYYLLENQGQLNLEG
jgi:hypothetical protein